MMRGLNLFPIATHSVEDRSRVHALRACRSSDTGLGSLNGPGRSTSLRLVAWELRPIFGSALTTGSVGYLAQNATLQVDATVADLLSAQNETRLVLFVMLADWQRRALADRTGGRRLVC
jgi:ATPase subunit of ABC transporter with duplicated ATPase domains